MLPVIAGETDAGVKSGPGHRMTALRTLSHLGSAVLDVVLPPLCLGCNAVVDSHRTLCVRCWSTIRFVGPPLCDWCGHPHPADVGPELICAACAQSKPPYARARSVFLYDKRSRNLILKFKYADRTDAAPAFARWMARAGADLVRDADVIVPVPLHWTRLLSRKYNQAALLAQALARLSGKVYAPNVVTRVRRTPPLGHAGASARQRLVRGVFQVSPADRPRLAGRRVLLIDDVLTTGATARACARTALRAGAEAVDLLTLSRVDRDA
jgi:ComF family protein